MLQIENNTHNYYICICDGNKKLLFPDTVNDILEWKANKNIQIGYINGCNEFQPLINQSQQLAGIFILNEKLNIKIPMPPDISFICKDENTKYNNEQYRYVSEIFQCKCTQTNCLCIKNSRTNFDMAFNNTKHLIKRGFVTQDQLTEILNNIFVY